MSDYNLRIEKYLIPCLPCTVGKINIFPIEWSVDGVKTPISLYNFLFIMQDPPSAHPLTPFLNLKFFCVEKSILPIDTIFPNRRSILFFL